MEQVDFGYIGIDGLTIYRSCFEKYLNARNLLKVPEAEWSKIVLKAEEVFFFLVDQGNKNGYNVDAILEKPIDNGETCFHIASRCSKMICSYVIQRDIRVNNIDLAMMVPDFKYPEFTIQMLKKGINPLVIDYDGTNRIHYHPSSFESKEAKRLLAEMPRSIHFSDQDIECAKSCPADCPSKFKRFYYKNGPMVEMTEENRIGEGGFGLVYKQLFHGKPVAMKCLRLGKIYADEKLVGETVKNHEKAISELRIPSAIAGPGVIVPVAFVRQQDQEEDENGNWVAENHDIYIYPLYDCNLYELHQKHYSQFTDKIMRNILFQCLTRKCSRREFNR